MISPFQINPKVLIPAIVLALSAGAHSLLLLVPMPQSSESALRPNSPETESDSIAVIMLPEDPEAEVAAVPEITQPSEPVAPPAAESVPLQPNVISEPVLLPVPDPDNLSAPTPDLNAEPELPLEDGLTSPGFVDPQPAADPASIGPLVGYSDTFPHVAGAEIGCFGLGDCRRVVGGGNHRKVATSLIDDLENEGYSVDQRDDLDDPGRNVYEVISPGDTTIQYLIVFSDGLESAVYVMSDEIITLAELQELAAQGVRGLGLG
ncbi:MAG: hypothetical protein AAGA01_09770 [Cyanobacteria bacterium P01_E01_bin.43]